MEGIITKGTTLHGKALNAGDRVDLRPDEFHKFALTGDIEIVTYPEPEPASAKPTKKK